MKQTIYKPFSYIENIDPKCLSCKFFCSAAAIQIWCDKLGIDENMPTKACDKYRESRTQYVMLPKRTYCKHCGGKGYFEEFPKG